MNRKMLDDSKLILAIKKEACFRSITPTIIYSEVAGYCGAVCYKYTVDGVEYCYAAEVEVLENGEYDVYNLQGGECKCGDDMMKVLASYDALALKAYRENLGIKF